jgi:predicted neuraminidase
MNLRLLSLLSVLSAIVSATLNASDRPIAKVITNPGSAYSDAIRSWQGIPGVERAANGRLWVTWYSGDVGEGAIGNYAMVSTSGEEGGKWTRPIVIEGPKGTRIGDPLPWIDPKGRLWIFYAQFTEKTDTTPAMRGTFAIRTDDPSQESPTWTAPFLVAEDGILFGKPIIRRDGAWIAPYFVNGKPSWSDKVAGKETGTLISKDEGATWTWLGGTSIAETLRNFSEATLAQRKDDSLWMVIRTSAGLYQSDSTDGGRTWSEATPMPGFEKGPSTRACMRKLASGAYLLVYHDVPPNPKGSYPRARLTAWLSEDEGRTWPHKMLLDERNRVSYPDATQAPDGRILIAYDLGRYQPAEKAVLVSILREEDIRAGKVASKDARMRLVVNQCTAYGNHNDQRNEEQVAAKLPPKDKLELYLLIGQSNMAGRGALANENALSQIRVLKLSPRNAWAPGVEPLHTDKPIAGAGIGMSFAREMADANPKVTIGLIPCAVGGTPLQRWQKGGDLYQQALVRAKVAMQTGTLKGILWHQGEGDSGKEDTARSYGARLSQMVKDLRVDLGAGDVPFVAGKLGEFLARQGKDGNPSFWPVVNEQLAELPKLVPHTAIVESDGLKHKGDGVHFDTASLREFGKRYAETMKKLQPAK